MFQIGGGDQSIINESNANISEIQPEKAAKESHLFLRSDIDQSGIFFEKDVAPRVQEDQYINMFYQGELSGLIQNMSVILQQPETSQNADKFDDLTQLPTDLMQELNELQDNSQLSYGLQVNRNFDRDFRQFEPDTIE